VQSEILDGGVGLQEVSQPLGHREYPLPNRQARNDVVGEMRGSLDHAAGITRRADAAPLTGKGDQKIVPAAGAARAGEAVGEDAAFEVAAKFPFDMSRRRVEHGAFRLATTIGGDARSGTRDGFGRHGHPDRWDRDE
jgi:hypothetical protein